jgi:hypothetical protein
MRADRHRYDGIAHKLWLGPDGVESALYVPPGRGNDVEETLGQFISTLARWRGLLDITGGRDEMTEAVIIDLTASPDGTFSGPAFTGWIGEGEGPRPRPLDELAKLALLDLFDRQRPHLLARVPTTQT